MRENVRFAPGEERGQVRLKPEAFLIVLEWFVFSPFTVFSFLLLRPSQSLSWRSSWATSAGLSGFSSPGHPDYETVQCLPLLLCFISCVDPYESENISV